MNYVNNNNNNNNNMNEENLRDIEKRIRLIKLMIEKRSQRVEYYQDLIKMGIANSDRMKLNYLSIAKEIEIYELVKELDWLGMQKSFYEV